MKLLPCPFCGSKGKTLIVATQGEITTISENKDAFGVSAYYAVCCSRRAEGCGATGGYYEKKKDAIANWNRRTK